MLRRSRTGISGWYIFEWYIIRWYISVRYIFGRDYSKWFRIVHFRIYGNVPLSGNVPFRNARLETSLHYLAASKFAYPKFANSKFADLDIRFLKYYWESIYLLNLGGGDSLRRTTLAFANLRTQFIWSIFPL